MASGEEAIIGRLLPLHLHTISTTEVVKDLFTALASEAFEIQRRTSLPINGGCDGPLLHQGLLPCDKLQPDLLPLRGPDHFPAFQNVAPAMGHGQGLVLRVEPLNAAQPLRSVVAVLVKFIRDRMSYVTLLVEAS